MGTPFLDECYSVFNDLVEKYSKSMREYYDEILNINQTVI